MNARRIPLLWPTGILAPLLFVLTAMWYAGASQSNAAAYVLLFLTASLFFVSIPHTLLNLTGLKVTVDSVKPAFAGQEVAVPVEIVNRSRRTRHGVLVRLNEGNSSAEIADKIRSGEAVRLTLRFRALSRGEYEITRLQLSSVFPLGFVRAALRIATQQRYLVFPKPEGDPALPRQNDSPGFAGAEAPGHDGDDFAGVRAYVTGESQRHIDWKAVARGQPMMTKQFAAETDNDLHFRFDAMTVGDLETRLSQLALWIVEAERARRRYGLRIPGTDIAPSSGEAHYFRCLRALALHR